LPNLIGIAKSNRYCHNLSVSNANEMTKLNQLIGDVKILVGSFSILDSATLNKDQVSLATAQDAINFRIRAIHKNATDLGLYQARTNPTNPSALQIDDVLLELTKPNPDAKVLHALLDDQLETLRKVALSEILTLSVE
jgi:hypothetical protein